MYDNLTCLFLIKTLFSLTSSTCQSPGGRRRHLRHERARRVGQVLAERARQHHGAPGRVLPTADLQNPPRTGQAAVRIGVGGGDLPGSAPKNCVGALPGPGEPPSEGAGRPPALQRVPRDHAGVRAERGGSGGAGADGRRPSKRQRLFWANFAQ